MTAKSAKVELSAGDRFGMSVDVSGDTIVIGAPADNHSGRTNAGAVYVFQQDAGGLNNWGQVARLTASDAASSDLFGSAVAIDQNTLVVGAYLDDDRGSASGSAYVFHCVGDVWSEAAKLTADDGAANDRLANSLAISGDQVVLGAYQHDSAGAAYVYHRNAGGAGAWEQTAKLTADDAAADDQFGFAVAIEDNTIVVGSRLDDTTAANTGSAYVFVQGQGSVACWNQTQRLTASDEAAGDLLGSAVAISGRTIVVGAPYDDGSASNSGSVVTFRYDDPSGLWLEDTKVTDIEESAGAQYGHAVDIDGDVLASGARLADRLVANGGAAMVQDLRTDQAVVSVTVMNLSSGALLLQSPQLPGDYNGDGTVDQSDRTVWVENFGATVTPFTAGDGNGNGVVDLADYTVWQDNLGMSLSAAAAVLSADLESATEVEPSTASLSLAPSPAAESTSVGSPVVEPDSSADKPVAVSTGLLANAVYDILSASSSTATQPVVRSTPEAVDRSLELLLDDLAPVDDETDDLADDWTRDADEDRTLSIDDALAELAAEAVGA